MRAFRSTLLISACALAIIGVLLAVGTRLMSGATMPARLMLIAATPLVPALTMLSTVRTLSRIASWVMITAGALIAGAGTLRLVGQSTLLEFVQLASPLSILLSAASFSAVGWVAVGVAAILAGVGLLTRLQTPVVLGAVILFVSTAFFAAGLLADSDLVRLVVIGPGSGSVSWAKVAGCLVLAFAAVLNLVIASARPVLPVFAERRSRSGAPVTRRRIAATAAGVSVIAALGVGLLVWSPWSHAEPISEVFADPALANCVADKLALPTDSDGNRYVSDQQLKRVTGLTCSGTPYVQSLAGLGRLTKVSSLILRENAIADLSPLADLPQLRTVDLTSNQISDLTPVAGMTQLTELNIANNTISDLSPLAGMAALTALDASSNQITDLSPVTGMNQLVELTVPRNQITDVAPLQAVTSLYRLDLADNSITDPSPLGALPLLTTLVVTDNQIADASLFSALPALTELSIGGNPVTDVRPLAQLTTLVGVDFRGSDSSNIVGLDDLRAQNIYVGGFAK